MKTDTTQLNHIERNVFGENLINTLSISAINKVIPQLEQYKGKKVILADNSKSKTFIIDTSIDKNEAESCHVWISSEDRGWKNDLIVKIKITIKRNNLQGGGYGAQYFEKEISLASLHGGKITAISTIDQIINDYNLLEVYDYQKVKSTLLKLETLMEEANTLKREVYKFAKF